VPKKKNTAVNAGPAFAFGSPSQRFPVSAEGLAEAEGEWEGSLPGSSGEHSQVAESSGDFYDGDDVARCLDEEERVHQRWAADEFKSTSVD
jgi:hypothetical protein